MFYEDHAAQVFFQPGTAGYLVITFSEMTMRADGQRFWGGHPLKLLGIPALGFVAKRKRWFADNFMRGALAAAQPMIEPFRARLAYGFSMGAYGAIRHAQVLGARTVVACSPQWTIDPARLEGQPQPFAEHFREDKHRAMELTSFPPAARLYLLHDPHERHDAWHVSKICEHIPQAVPVRMPFVGHGSVRPFASTPMLAALLESARSHDDGLVRGIARHARRTNPSRAALLAAHLLTRHFERGAALLRSYAGQGQAHVEAGVLLNYAQRALDMNRMSEAREMAERAARLSKGFPSISAAAQRLMAQMKLGAQ